MIGRQFERINFDLEKALSLTGKEQNDYLRKAAKRANTRLSALEKTGKTKGSAYQMARDFFPKGEERIRFTTSIPKDIHTRDAYIRKLNSFLNAKTSTIGGLNKWYNESGERLKEKFGITDFEKFKELYKSDAYKEAFRTYDSDVLFEVYAQFEDAYDIEEVLRLFDKINKSDVDVRMVQERARKAVPLSKNKKKRYR